MLASQLLARSQRPIVGRVCPAAPRAAPQRRCFRVTAGAATGGKEEGSKSTGESQRRRVADQLELLDKDSARD